MYIFGLVLNIFEILKVSPGEIAGLIIMSGEEPAAKCVADAAVSNEITGESLNEKTSDPPAEIPERVLPEAAAV